MFIRKVRLNMARYVVAPDVWVSPNEQSGTIQNAGETPIEVSVEREGRTGIVLGTFQMISFDRQVYVRSVGSGRGTFTTVPFNAVGKGGGGGGSPYTLPTMSTTEKGGAKLGDGLIVREDVLSINPELVPEASVSATSDGAKITIKDKNGTTSVNVYNGADGKDGANGKDGKDGENGKDGKDGIPLGYEYSGLEQEVGSWINGNSIYQLTVSATIPQTFSTPFVVADLTERNIQDIINLYGTVQGLDSEATDVSLYYVPETHSLMCRITNGSGFAGNALYATVFYTKV